ncbi:MAG: hypothetical protein ACOCZL_02700 [Bacteroidota bacterium]
MVRKLFRIEFIKTVAYGPVKILIPLHLLFFLLGFFTIPNIPINFPFLSVQPLYQFPHVWNFITWVGGSYNLTLVLLVIMLTCLEFNNKTFKHQVIFGLSRQDLFLQKVILAFMFALYATVLIFFTVLVSGLIYSYKITLGIMFERSWILLNTFLQSFTWLMTGIMFALIFKNMILSVLIFGFYRVILEPVVRNLVPDAANGFFPTKFVSKLTPEPDILNMVKENIQSSRSVSPDELAAFESMIPEGVPIWQNLILTLIFLGMVSFFIHFIFNKRRLT